MKRSRNLFLIGVLAVGLGLAGCRRQPAEEPVPAEEQAVEEANRFLSEQGINLPEGAERGLLSGEEGNRGVATREMGDNQQTYTIVADLAAPLSGVYYGWVRNSQGAGPNLGVLVGQKSGYVGERTTAGGWGT